MRIETVVNDTTDLGVLRRLELGKRLRIDGVDRHRGHPADATRRRRSVISHGSAV